MPIKDYKFQLPVKEQNLNPVCTVVQHDSGGNKFHITLIDQGKPFDLTGATLVTFTALKEDNTISIDNAVIDDAETGKISYLLSDQCVSYPGSVKADIEVYTGVVRVTSTVFVYEVRKDLSIGADPGSSSDLPILQGLITEVSDLKQDVETAEAARVIAEGLRVAAESGKAIAESSRVITEGLRVIDEGTRDANEIDRENAESARIIAETVRSVAEGNRVTAESARAASMTAFAVYEEYNPLTPYVALNKVTYNGSSYACKIPCTGVTPGTDPTKWLMIAAKGADGAGAGDMLASVYDPDGDGKFTPEEHKTTHATGGSDVLTPADIGAETPSDAQAKATAAQTAANTYTDTKVDARISAGVADLAALKAINTTLLSDRVCILVESLGWYRFDSASAVAGDDDIIVVPTVGSGRWIKMALAQYVAGAAGAQDLGFNADLEYYYGNTKLVTDTETLSQWVAGGYNTIATDTANNKIGTNALKIVSNSNSVYDMFASRSNMTAIDLSKLNSGDTFATTDYICIPVTISDVTKVNNIGIQLSSDASFPSATNVYYTTISAGLVTGFNLLKILKSAFSSIGAPNWANIQSVELVWHANANSLGAYVTFDDVWACKKDPSVAAPNPFQRKVNNAYIREFAINSGEWFVGLEFGKVIAKNLNPITNGASSTASGLVGTKPYTDFSIQSTFVLEQASYSSFVTWEIDSNNRISANLQISGSPKAFIITAVAGVNDITTVAPFTSSVGDTITIRLKRIGTTVTATFIKNNNQENALILTKEVAFSSVGYLALGDITGYSQKHLSLSITTIEHAHHASIAEMSKSVINQAWEKISDITLLVNSAQVDLIVPPGYKALKVLFVCESSTATTRNLLVRANDISSSLYGLVRNKLVAASNTASGAAGDTAITLTEALEGNTEDYSVAGEILFQNTRPNANDRLSGNFSYSGLLSATFNYTGGFTIGTNITINKISFIASADAIAQGSYFVLKGVR